MVFLLLSSGYVAIASASGYGEAAVSSSLMVTVTVDISGINKPYTDLERLMHGVYNLWEKTGLLKKGCELNLLFSTQTDAGVTDQKQVRYW